MKMKIKFTLLPIIIFLISSCSRSTNDNNVHNNSEAILIADGFGKRIDSLLQKEVKIGFSGAVAVLVNGQTVLRNGYGWTDSTREFNINPHTKFYLASVTKGFTGVAALVAQEKEYFNLKETPLSNLSPDIPETHASITMHELLIQTSGIPEGFKSFGFDGRDENVAQVVKVPLESPGEFNYTGANYWLTAAMIESSIGFPYEEFVHSNLFEVSNMEQSGFYFESNDNDPRIFAQKLTKFPPTELAPNWGYMASGGITTNIYDLESYFNSLTSFELLKEKSLNQLFGPHITLNNGIGIGYGWYTSKTKRGTSEIWSRGGEEFGHNCAIRWFKDEDIVIIILASCGAIDGDIEANRTVSDKIENLIFQ